MDLHVIHNGEKFDLQDDPGNGEDHGTSIITLKNVNKKKGIYRFYAHILKPKELMNETFKIFYFNCDTVKVIDSPVL